MEAGGGRPKQRIHEMAVEGGGRQEQRLHKAAVAGDVDTLTEILDGNPNVLDMVKVGCFVHTPLHVAAYHGHLEFIAMASDVVPHDDVPPIIVTEGDLPSPVPEVDILASATGVESHDKDSIVEDIEVEPEPLSLRTRRFDLVTYRPCTHTMGPGGMLRFTEFSRWIAEDVLLWERTRHLSHESFMTEELIDIKATFRRVKAMKAKDLSQGEWLSKKRDILMVMASLIATMAFQAGLNPQRGFWQDNT
ncbi:hypothetical protein LOK49_LG03G02392 [Camellia lanceoleosa]|uniref:Uncharacterized protein n=1 Tax=Camellia lanceoleosa TaxID=1840588 RepID=A0ACC0IB68_9ERIC|nr:hypothetical protein LOK49_LG03G02392 [Camellia lanceoleosa]